LDSRSQMWDSWESRSGGLGSDEDGVLEGEEEGVVVVVDIWEVG
jgi:hypothetical protein